MLLSVRLALAAVFLLAGIAKLADRAGAAHALAGFRVPRRLVAPFATALPLFELAVAAALLVPASALAGAGGALALLAGFCAAIALAMARGEQPECHCFGQLHSAPAGPAALARNALIGLLAALVLVLGWSDPGPSAVSWLGALSGGQLAVVAVGSALSAALAAVTFFALGLLRRHGTVLARLEALEMHTGVKADSLLDAAPARAAGLPVGTEAPMFRAQSAEDGAPVGLDALLAAGRPLALVFADPGCAPCNALLGELGDLQRRLGEELTIGVLTRGSLEHARAKAQEHGLSGVMSDEHGEAAKSFEVAATPAAVVIDGDGRVATSLALGSEAVTGVLHEAAGRRDRGLRVGDELPGLDLHDLDGRPRESASVLTGDRPTLLVLWNPGCGFCRSMERDLASRAAQLGEGDPRVVLVSTGSEQEIAALGFGFPVFQDRQGAAVRRLGTRGTPSALLLAADGTLAAPPAVGREAIFALMPAPPLHVTEVAA